LWQNFARLWQDTPAEGGEKARLNLGLDQRPVVLLATNVLGDSLTLGRQVFSQSMAEWIARTVQYFAGRPDVQFVIRVHPGEVLTHGVSMVDVVREVLPRLPEHIRLITPKDKMNTYDLMEVADLGLVYTTTVGLEMAMCGVPVITSGQTHYRGRGFTYDPDSWVSYFKMLGQILAKPSDFRLSRPQVESAWEYAYRFFFEYPRPFPWHLVRVWDDYKARPLASVLGPEGKDQYGETFRYLVGDPIDWHSILEAGQK
jgi:capsule polysaccharide export protein KpsC/LpsZ